MPTLKWEKLSDQHLQHSQQAREKRKAMPPVRPKEHHAVSVVGGMSSNLVSSFSQKAV